MNNFDLRKFLAEGKKAKEVEEAAPGFSHDCAAHVVHETYGYGICLEGQHTLVENAEGEHVVTHYDVFFKEGSKIVANIPVEELVIESMEEHSHSKKKNEEEVSEDLGVGLLGSLALMLGTVGLDKFFRYLEKEKPEMYDKIKSVLGGDGTKYGGGSGKMAEEEEADLHETKFKEEIKNILNN